MQVCSFLWVYYGFPTSCYEGRNVEDVRFRFERKWGKTTLRKWTAAAAYLTQAWGWPSDTYAEKACLTSVPYRNTHRHGPAASLLRARNSATSWPR